MAMKNRRRAFLRPFEFALVALVLAGLGYAAWFQAKRFGSQGFRSGVYRQKIKLPSSDALRWVTLGYDNVYADWLWLQAIQNFGAGWVTEDNSVEPIYEYFDTITDLDPNFIAVYRFGNLIIGDQRRDFARGLDLIDKGIHHNPRDFDLPFLGLYCSIWETGNLNKAKFYAKRLQRIPETPGYMKRLEEYIERKSGRFEAAYDINVRYYLEYLSHKNDIEREIVLRRMQAVLDKWYVQEFAAAIKRYRETFGEDPRRMEELLDPRFTEDYEAPTIPGFINAVADADEAGRIPSKMKSVPDELVDFISKASIRRISGMPPEPFGYWYFIFSPFRSGFDASPETYADFEAPYIVSAKEQMDKIGAVISEAESFLFEYREKHKRLPTHEEFKRFLVRDALGGHYVYRPDENELDLRKMFHSTARERVLGEREWRMGLQGRGPFRGPLEPSLYDNPEEAEWGRKEGFITPEGLELWFHPDAVAEAKRAEQRSRNTNENIIRND